MAINKNFTGAIMPKKVVTASKAIIKVDGIPFAFVNADSINVVPSPVRVEQPECWHRFIDYVGFSEKYRYCEKCGVKE